MENKFQQDKFNYVKLNTEKYQNSIEEGIKFLQSMVVKNNRKLDIEVRDYLCLIYDIKLLEEHYLTLQTDFSSVLLKWSVKDKKDLDHLVIMVVGLRKQYGKSLSSLTQEEKEQINVDNETWEKYLFIDNIINLDKFKCIERDVEKLIYIYNNNIGNIMISGLHTINSKNIESLYLFLKQHSEKLDMSLFDNNSQTGQELDEKTQEIQQTNISELIENVNSLQQNLFELNINIQNLQRSVDNVKHKVDDLESKITENVEQSYEKNVLVNHENLIEKIEFLENKVVLTEQKLEEINISLSNKDDGEEIETVSEIEQSYIERLDYIESQVMSLKEDILNNIDQRIYEVFSTLMTQYKQEMLQDKNDSNKKEKVITEETKQEMSDNTETETPIVVDDDSDEGQEKQSSDNNKKKKIKTFNFKLFLIIWFIIFILFIAVLFILK